MYKKFLSLTVVGMVLSVAAVVNAQSDSQQALTSQYENFVKRTDVVIVTQSYPLSDLPGGGGFRVSAKVSWALGEARKVYAVDLGGRIIDFDQLAGIQEGLDKMIGAVTNSFDSLNMSSISYKSPAGVSASYYSYVADGSDKPARNLYVSIGTYMYQTGKMDSLTPTSLDSLQHIRTVIAQSREKLVSLGAK
jgi:hypothetical protein